MARRKTELPKEKAPGQRKRLKGVDPTRIPLGARRGRRTKDEPRDWHPEFLAALRVSGLIEDSIKAIGIARTTFFDHRRTDSEFAAQVDRIQDAHRHVLGHMLAEGAIMRAIRGEEKTVVEFGLRESDDGGEPAVVEVGRSITTSFPPQRERFMLERYLPEHFGPAEAEAGETPADHAERLRVAFAAMMGSVEAKKS